MDKLQGSYFVFSDSAILQFLGAEHIADKNNYETKLREGLECRGKIQHAKAMSFKSFKLIAFRKNRKGGCHFVNSQIF